MKNQNKRPYWSANNKENAILNAIISVLCILATLVIIAFVYGCAPVKGKRIHSEWFKYDKARIVVWENDTALIFTKKRKVIQVVPKQK